MKNNEKERFEYTYSSNQQKEINEIRDKYLPKKENKIEKLIRLDKKIEVSAVIISSIAGVIGIVILGIGMRGCLLLENNINTVIVATVIALTGIFISSAAYPLYKKVLEKKRMKYANQILELCNELLF